MTRGIDASQELGRLIRFGIVGAVATLVYAVITMIMLRVVLWAPVPASILGHVAAMGVSYFGHSMYSFAVETDHKAYVGKFLTITALTFGLNVITMWSLAEVLHAQYWIAVATVTVLIPVVNFVCNRYWVFLPGLQ